MTKNKKREEWELVKKTARLYQSIARNSMDGFCIIDIKGHFFDVNNTYCRLLGFSKNEFLEMNISDVEARNKPTDVVKYIQHLKRRGKKRYFTQHRKKNGAIVDIEVSANYTDYLGGLIFIYLRDFTEIRKTERDQYRNRAESRKILEGQLTNAYTHLGKINRKISLLFELDQYPKSKKGKQQTLNHVLNLAMNISNSSTGYLYQSKGKGKFDLLSHKGLNGEQKDKIKIISARTIKLLKHLIKEKKLISGYIKGYEAELLVLDNELKYFVTIPLSKGTSLGGFIFLGFDKKNSVDAQDLEFLDVFAMHASIALAKAGVLK